jgi:hypothetical protein
LAIKADETEIDKFNVFVLDQFQYLFSRHLRISSPFPNIWSVLAVKRSSFHPTY